MSLRFLVGAAGLTAALLVPSVTAAAPAAPVASDAPAPPSAPRTPTVAPGHGSATVTWTAPASTGGSPVLSYRVRVAPANRVVTVAAPATTATVTGLADGTQVTATVTAVNRVGAGPAASAGTATPTPPITTVAQFDDAATFGDLAVAPDGTTYVATASAIVEISADGTTTTPLPVDVVNPYAIALGPNGDLFWSQNSGQGGAIVRRLHEGSVSTVAGDPDPGTFTGPVAGPVPALEAQLVAPLDLAVSPIDGSVFVVDYLCSVVQQFTVGGTLQVVAGTPGNCSDGAFDGDGGPATEAHLKGPQGVAVDDSGNVYVADTWNDRVRRFTVGGSITTVAGDGTDGMDLDPDQAATSTAVPMPAAIAWSPGRGLVIDSLGRHRLLSGDRLLRFTDDAHDRALLESTAEPGAVAIATKENTRSIAWIGTTLQTTVVVPDGEGGWTSALKEVGPWLAATEPSEHPGYGSWADLVKLHHRAFLDRAPTSAELTTWVAALDAGTETPGQLDDALRRSQENTANVDPVVRLYRAFLGRAPDAGGLRFWIARKRAVAPAKTTTVGQMAAQFAGSSEFQRKYGSLSNRAFVTRIYTDVLDRPADKGGVDFWTKRLDTKRLTRAQVMVNFSESTEYQRKQAANTDVAIAYLSLVGRMPTATETTAWTTAVTGGATNAELLDALVNDAPHLL